MSTVTKCTCGHLISEHTYSGDFTGCDVSDCNCMLDLGELIDKYAKEVADRTEQNLKDAKRIAELENFIRTRNVVCTWCGYTVVYDNENEEEKQAARDKVNAHSLVCEKDPRTIELKQVEANYDALQSPMPCGHLARYAVNGDEGTQYCVLCESEAWKSYALHQEICAQCGEMSVLDCETGNSLRNVLVNMKRMHQ